MTARTDAELVAAARRGEAEAFGELVERHAARAVRVAGVFLHNRVDAEDAAEDAFLRALGRLDGLKRPEAFGPWLLRLVTTVSLNARRARRRRRHDDLSPELPDPGRGPAAAAADRELGEALAGALGELAEERRVAVILCLVEGFNASEAGAWMGLPPGTVRSHLHHARARLRAALGRFTKE